MVKNIMKFARIVVLVGGVVGLGYWGVTSLRAPKHHHSQGDLYFNIHTKAQTFFGDIRGQFYLAAPKK